MIRDVLTRRRSASRFLASVLSGALMGFFMAGCDGSSQPGSGEGEVRMHMVDAPANVEAVMVAVSRVEVHTAGSAEGEGWVTINDTPSMYDLLTLRNGSSALIAGAKLKAGHYTQIRLILGTGSHVVVNGLPVALEVASGFQTGVKLVHQFTIEEDKVYELTLDFDAERSLIPQGVGFRLHPVIRVTANEVSGSVSGTVLPVDARAMVMAMAGTDTVTTTVCDSASGMFRIVALPEGTYDLRMSATTGMYRDTVIANVAVTRQSDTPVGTVTLSAGVNP